MALTKRAVRIGRRIATARCFRCCCDDCVRMRRPHRFWCWGRGATLDKLDRIVTAQREAARSNRCAFWDMRQKMGGKGAMREWVTAGLAQYDHVHFTAPGYRRLGYTLFRDLMYNYDKYTKVRDELARAGSNEQTGADH